MAKWLVMPHVLGGSRDALVYVKALKAAGLRVPAVKLVNSMGQAREFRDAGAELLIGRPTRRDPSLSEVLGKNPVTEAQAFVREFLKPHILANPLIQAWEVWNEPTVNDEHEMRWMVAFCAEAARVLWVEFQRAGVHLNFSTGNPSLNLMRFTAPLLEAIRRYGGYIGMHEYANKPHIVNGQIQHGVIIGQVWSLLGRQKQVNEIWRELGYMNVPVVITETGLDRTEPGAFAFRDSGSQYDARQYAALMAEYNDYMVRECPNVVALTIFTWGTDSPGWVNHNVDETGVAAELLGQAKARLVPPRPEPLFEFDGSGLRVPLFNAPHGLFVREVFDVKVIHVWEKQGEWWRVTKSWWMRRAPLKAVV